MFPTPIPNPYSVYDATHAMLCNRAGYFGPGFFTAAFGTSATVTLMGSGVSGTPGLGTVIFRPRGGFGGVMSLAGSVLENFSGSFGSGLSQVTFPALPGGVIGGPAVPNTAFTSVVFRNTVLGPTTFPIKRSGFPWITGRVTLIQSQGILESLLTEAGENALSVATTGSGAVVATASIKLVTGWLAHLPALGEEHVGEYQLDLTFLPEPSQGELAGAGLLFAVGLHRLRRLGRSRARPPQPLRARQLSRAAGSGGRRPRSRG